MSRLVRLVVALTLLVAAAGCAPAPGDRPTDPGPAAEQLRAALSAGDLSGIPANVDAQADLAEILRGMDGVRPEVTLTKVRRSGDMAEVDVHYSWPFANPWEYDSTATLNWVKTDPSGTGGGHWQLRWLPGTLHPQLSTTTRLVHTHDAARRGRIMAQNGAVIAEESPVLQIGIDRSRVSAEESLTSARRLAEMLEINPDNYVALVQAAGPEMFVTAITLRPEAAQPEGWREIPGAIGVPTTRTISRDRDFAPELIGTVGTATAEDAAAAPGRVFVGDPVGVSGLQKRHDEMLRGRPATLIRVVPRTSSTPSPNPTSSPNPGDPTPTSSPSPTPSTGIPTSEPMVLFDAPAAAGTDLVTHFDYDRQITAERLLTDVPGPAAIVAVRPSTGELVAAATSPGSAGNPEATFGRYAPGSTFKVVTALALIRRGITPDTAVPCTNSVTVDGRTFTNYSGFPPDRIRDVSLTEALAASCNTAFISQHDLLEPEDLQNAAISLGFGTDYEAGFPAFFGLVGDPPNVVGEAESMIGQGTVEASPMAMAAVAASVSAGHTVIPRLVAGSEPPAVGEPLTPDEAAALQRMMSAVVSEGTASSLEGSVTGAKTGTAEYGTETPLRTHAWMIGYTDDLAVAVWLKDGDSGSTSAGPLLQRFLG